MINYLRTGAVREPWVGFEADHMRVNYGFEFFRCHGTKLHRDHDVHLTVTLQDWEVLVAAWCLQDRHKSVIKVQLRGMKNSKKNGRTETVPMGNSCEVEASSWGPQHQLTDTGRSRQCTRTGPHPEEEGGKQTEVEKRETFITCII